MTIVTWDESDTPISEQFDDPYYSRGDGQAESRYVFLNGNGLPARWHGEKSFTIAELGFGTGLNFLETVAAWLAIEPEQRPKLTFVSFELYPMTRSDLTRALGAFDGLAALTDELLQQWSPSPGWSNITVSGARLELGIGDAAELLPSWNGVADAWYLDGFSPAKNPELWDAALMRDVFNHTASHGTFATFTAAGWVRRNLIDAGFDVEKMPGFGRKRECLRGQRPD